MQNLSSILVGLAVAAVFVAIVARGIWNRVHGKGGCCGGNCAGCGCCCGEQKKV